MKSKKKLKIRHVIWNLMLTIVIAILIIMAYHSTMLYFEKRNYQPIGQLVEVDGKNMHIFIKGEGEATVLLLTGLGTAAPILDFEPLINELANSFQVVVVEPFGYGWSDLTDEERIVENIVEELRTALKEANIDGPYILMPHSISGIYSMYYANKYPNEVKAIIGIDPTLPKAYEYFYESAPTLKNIFKYMSPIGITRILMLLFPEDLLPIAEEGTYTEENIKMTKFLSAKNIYNETVVSEINEIENNVKKTKELQFPNELPVMIFTNKVKKETKDGKTNITFYQTQLENVSSSKLVILDGHHYLHWTQFKEINEQVKEFLSE